MKKALPVLVTALALLAVLALPVLAGKPPKGEHGRAGQAGSSNVAFLELLENDANWDIVEDGAWGKMKYNLEGPQFCFVFNGHGLDPSTGYKLIYYADHDPRFEIWGGDNPGALIATGATNRGGNIHLNGCVELNMDLPSPSDWNIDPEPDYCDYENEFDDYDNCSGAKVWLVPSDLYNDVANKVTSWLPTRFLFETDLITYDDTQVP